MSPRRSRLITILLVLYITFIGGTAYAHIGEIPDTVRLVFIVGPMILWLVDLIRSNRALPRTPLDWPLLAAAIWLPATALGAQDRRISLELVWPFLAHILGFYLLVDLMRRGWARHFQAALLVVAVLIVVISGVELAVWYVVEPGWYQVGGLSDPIPPILPKLDLALGITTIEGNYVAMLIPPVIAGVLAARRRARIALGLLALALLVVEVLTFSRGGLLGALVGVGVLAAFVLHRWQARTGRTLLQPRLILAGALLAVFGAGLFIVVWTASASRSASDEGRLDTWRSALDMARDHPVTGVGPGLFGRTLRYYRDPDLAQDKLVSAHNLPLNILAETGVPGLVIALGTAVVLGRVWWQRWQTAPPERRLWLEAALAAFVAYGVHSLVDVFPLTSSVLPLLILAAYIVTPPAPSPTQAEERGEVQRRSARLVWVVLAVTLLYTAALVRLDVAQVYFNLSRLAIHEGDLPTALDRAEQARRWDPALSLYDLHYAYVLGLLAERDSGYLADATLAHLDALAQEPTFDVGWANLAALYGQRGRFGAAREALRQAAAINPANAAYWFKLNDARRALELNPDLAEYFVVANPSAVEQFLSDSAVPAGQRLYAAVLLPLDRRGVPVLTRQRVQTMLPQLAADAETESGWLAHLALGVYAHRILGDDEAAIGWLAQAIHERPTDERAWLERAEIHLAQGELDRAEYDARRAVFVDPYDGAYGYAILAQIEQQRGADDDTIERLLKASVRPRPAIQYFSGTVYARKASFDFLPQFDAPGLPSRYYAGWFMLAERYRAQGNPDEARRVYLDLLDLNPYLDAAEDALRELRQQ